MKKKASAIAKQKAEPLPAATMKLRTKRPRRRAAQFSPVVLKSSLRRKYNRGVSDSSSSSFLDDDGDDDNFSCGSSRASSSRKRHLREIEADEKETVSVGDDPTPFRRITRSYYNKQKENERRGPNNEVEVSESSCVDSLLSGADSVAFKSLKVKKREHNVKNDIGAVSVTRSDVTCFEQVSDAGNLRFSSKNKENDVVSVTSGIVSKFRKENDVVSVTSCVGSMFGSITGGNDNETASLECELSEISKPNGVPAEQELKSGGLESDLACRENFSCDDVSVYSENAISELQTEIFPENWEFDSSDYTPSVFFDSGSEFSEKSFDDASPSQTYSLFLEFKEQFRRSTVPNTVKPTVLEEHENPPPLVRFEDADEEDSYQGFRERERRQVYLRDYADYGDLVLRQRLHMVRWIVEKCTEKELQQETMFLGVSLLDQFLSRGFFKTERNLQIVGIACLALATRIEENQPYNSVRQRNFHIQNNRYSRSEVVAMEWLVQEVLNFQCFLPTIYNFLWFYLKAARADAEVEKKAKYLAILALSDHGQLCYWPSTVAAALVILASIDSNKQTACKQVIKVHVRTKDIDLPECVKSLEWLLSM